MFDCKSKFDKLEFRAFDIETEGCMPCKDRAKEWIWVGCMLLPSGQEYKATETYKPQWKKVALTSDNIIPSAKQQQQQQQQQQQPQDEGGLAALPGLIGIELPKHIRSAPQWLPGLTGLRRLGLSHCAFLADLNLGPLEQLDKVEYEGCSHTLALPERLKSARG
jgi:hypothetical protein